MSTEAVIPSEKMVNQRTQRDHATDSPDKPRRIPRYVVIIENDEHHTFPYVQDVLREVCGHSRQRAYQLTNQVHFRGQAHVWVGPLEHAELKRDLIRGYGPDVYARQPVSFPLGTRIEQLPD